MPGVLCQEQQLEAWEPPFLHAGSQTHTHVLLGNNGKSAATYSRWILAMTMLSSKRMKQILTTDLGL